MLSCHYHTLKKSFKGSFIIVSVAEPANCLLKCHFFSTSLQGNLEYILDSNVCLGKVCNSPLQTVVAMRYCRVGLPGGSSKGSHSEGVVLFAYPLSSSAYWGCIDIGLEGVLQKEAVFYRWSRETWGASGIDSSGALLLVPGCLSLGL